MDFKSNKAEYIKIIIATILINVLMIIIPLFQKNLIDRIADASLSKDDYFNKFKEVAEANIYNEDFPIDRDLFLDILDIKNLDNHQANLAIREAFKNSNDSTYNLLADIKVNKNYYIQEKYNKLIDDLNLGY